MSFVAIPIFIGGVEFTHKEYLILILGLGLSFGIVLPSVMYETSNNLPCSSIEPGDSEAIKNWKASECQFKTNVHINTPIIVSVVGYIIIGIGMIRYLHDKKQNKPIKLVNANLNRTYPKGFEIPTQNEVKHD